MSAFNVKGSLLVLRYVLVALVAVAFVFTGDLVFLALAAAGWIMLTAPTVAAAPTRRRWLALAYCLDIAAVIMLLFGGVPIS
jgi:ABC-type multidrug transport system permease subunit